MRPTQSHHVRRSPYRHHVRALATLMEGSCFKPLEFADCVAAVAHGYDITPEMLARDIAREMDRRAASEPSSAAPS